MMFKLVDYFAHDMIIRDGIFNGVGPVNVNDSLHKNILCYALTYEYLQIALKNPLISAIIVPPELKDYSITGNKAVVIDVDAEKSYSMLKNKLIESGYLLPLIEYKISKSAMIDQTAQIGKKCFIGENVIIGRNCIIKDYTFIQNNCVIGDNCTLGNEGLYFKRDQQNRLYKVLHSGGVYLDQNVEILNNSMVQRSHDSSQLTFIGEGSKISVNVNIGHSSKIGKHTLVSGNVQISGRVVIGDYCWIGTSSTISDSVIIQNHAKIRIGSIVVKNVLENQDVSGNFAYDHIKRIRNYVKEQK